MLAFIIGLVWLLVDFGNDKGFHSTTESVYDFLWWWYTITSILVFFSIFTAADETVTDEISQRFLKGISQTPCQCVMGLLMAFTISRVLLYVGLSFINKSVLIEDMVVSNKFTAGAIILFLGAMMGTASMFPIAASTSLQQRSRFST